jgi:anti-sigma B factor antagonist
MHGSNLQASDLVKISQRWSTPDAVVVSVVGEIDLYSAPVLEASFRQTIVENASKLVVDLTEVRFLSAAGITVLLRANEHQPLQLVIGASRIKRPLRLTGSMRMFSVHDSVDEALRAPAVAQGD